MQDSDRKLTVVWLKRVGERTHDSADAGLAKDGVGGEDYIRDIEKMQKATPFEWAFYARSRIARETLEAIVKHSILLMAPEGERFRVEERREIYTEAFGQWKLILDQWQAILDKRRALAQGGDAQTRFIGDLEACAKLCKEKGLGLEEGFLDKEGERIYRFIEGQVLAAPKQVNILCLMHWPLPETVYLWLWKNHCHPFLKEIKTLDKIQCLAPIDDFSLIFSDGKFFQVRVNRYREAVAEMKLMEAAGRAAARR